MASNNDDVKILTPEFRVSHPHVFKPSKMKGDGKEMYSIEMLFDKKTTKLSVIQAPVLVAIKEKWGNDNKKWPKPLRMPYRDGDKPHGKKQEVKPEHEGMWVVRASSKAEYSKPHVVGCDPNVALENEAELYPGCYARADLKAFAYTFADKDGVKFILNGVQFLRNGKAIGGRKPANQMFGVVEGDDGVEELGNDEPAFDASDDDLDDASV